MKKLILALLLSAASLSGIAQEKITRCKGVTVAGAPCRMAAKETGYCSIHDPASARCGFIKKDGKPCKMRVKVAGTRCYHHEG